MNSTSCKNEITGTLKLFAHAKRLNQTSDILYLVESGHGENGYFVRMVQAAVDIF
jgi:hypothetical protein